MPKPSYLALAEIRDDIRTVHDQLRDALPVLIALASDGPQWPDSPLGDVAVTMAQGIVQLHDAAGLLEGPTYG